MAKRPRFSDTEKHRRPYVRSDRMRPNYLKAKFDEIRREQREEAERDAAKVSPLKRVATK